jgi:hypothetical protein
MKNTCGIFYAIRVRAVPHGWRLTAIFRDFPGFQGRERGRKGHSTIAENGINKKRLPQLISIVNLAKL